MVTILLRKGSGMVKNFFRIPGTFDPDDHRRRQVLNILLIVFIVWALLNYAITNFMCRCGNTWSNANSISLLIAAGLFTILAAILFVVNRSPRVPGWLTGMVFISMFILILTQSDKPESIYGGWHLVRWVMPIMVTAMILRPGYVFVTTLLICAFMQFLMPLTPRYNLSQVNYY